jgi:hypothetical protein
MEKRRNQNEVVPGVFPRTPAGEPPKGRGIQPGTATEDAMDPAPRSRSDREP